MVTENRQVLPDGNRIRQTSTSRIYRDAEGRVRTEQSLGGLGSLGAEPVGDDIHPRPGAGIDSRSTWR